MKRTLIIATSAVASLILILHWGCSDRVTGTVRQNQPPKTRVWVDTLGVTQTSRVRLFWSGDDPDGFVKGYFVSVDTAWTYTTSQDSLFLIPLGGLDTLLARFRVAAVDAEGNGVWDGSVAAGGISFGPEPFVDLDNNLQYTPGEPFTDLGLVDPNPPQLLISIRNTPPTVGFAALTNVPSTTLPAASFFVEGKDLDGNETIVRYLVSLNQPDRTAPGWVELPPTASVVTLVGDLTQPGDTIPATVFLGTDLDATGLSVPGLRLNQQNVLYVYCEDLSGASSATVRMPDTSSTWFVKKPVSSRRLLLVNDYGTGNPDPLTVYSNALAAADDGKGGAYSDIEVLDLVATPVPALLHRPMLIATFRLYSSVFWFARIANLNFAQNTLPVYMQGGGKVLFTTGFQNFIDAQGLPIDFMPIDSLVTNYVDSTGGNRFGFIPRVYLNSVVRSSDTTAFPDLVYDRTAIFGSYAVVEAPGQQVVYRLDVAKNPPNTQEFWTGTPTVGVLSAEKNILVFTMPLHLLNTTAPGGKNRLVSFFESTFRDTFGL